MSSARDLESKFEQLKKKLSNSSRYHNIELITDAFRLAKKAHKHQKRASKEDYIIHPLSTALILSDYDVDDITIVSALLHDVVEDTQIGAGAIERIFGKEVSKIVDGVTKIDSIPKSERKKWEKANFEKFFNASSQNMRVLLVKLADKIHNLSTLEHLPKEKQVRIAKEALELYAPLAENLGIKKMRYEIEALAFPKAFPKEYASVKKNLEPRKKRKKKFLVEMSKKIEKKLSQKINSFELKINDIEYYSVLLKMESRGKVFKELYDYSYLKIITDSADDCYTALGIVHSLFAPIPKKVKDYIALPSNITYQSIHTTVILPNGQRAKVIIRSREMDRLASWGIISFIDDEKRISRFVKDKFELIRSGRIDEEEDFVLAVKKHVLDDAILVFDSGGKKRIIPRHSTVLDFAYLLGERMGNHCLKARVNGKEVPLWKEVERGDKIEIVTGISRKIHPEWLEYAKTINARDSIKKALSIKPASEIPTQQAKIKINAKDKVGLLAEIAKIVSSKGINISSSSMNHDVKNKNITMIQMTIDVPSKKEFESLLETIEEHKSVISVFSS